MNRWFSFLRAVAGQDDRQAAFAEEATSLQAASETELVDARFVAEMRSGGGGIEIGRLVHDEGVAVRLAPDDVAGRGHSLVLGATGSGKTYAVAGVLRQLLTRGHAGSSMGLVIVDHKSELCEITRRLVGGLVATGSPAAWSLLNRLVVVNPFSASALVPLQMLLPEPNVDPEVQAFEVTSLIDRLGGAELGVRQESFLYHLLLLGITSGLSLPAVAALLANADSLQSAALGSRSGEVRAFFAGAARLAQSSLEGVRARLHRLLRLPSSRLMLGARGCVSFSELLEGGKIVLIDVGSPPLGCEDLARFWAGIVTLKLTRAFFTRPQHQVRHPVAVFVDEWQEGLAAGGDIADHYERVLTMARSRGISLWLISQSLAGAARVSSSLPRVVATNTGLQFLFRASAEDANAMAHMLPVTGRRPQPQAAPWERAPASPFLSVAEERRLLVEEAARLPDRSFYLWNRRRPYPAQLVRACDVRLPVGEPRDRDAARVLRDGTLAVSIAELERQARRETAAPAQQVAFRPVRREDEHEPQPRPQEPPAPRRGGRPRRRHP